MPSQSYERPNGPVPTEREGQPEEENSRRQRSIRVLDGYAFGKTLGVGSIRKVRLAQHLDSGEKVCLPYNVLCAYVSATSGSFQFAIKILPPQHSCSQP